VLNRDNRDELRTCSTSGDIYDHVRSDPPCTRMGSSTFLLTGTGGAFGRDATAVPGDLWPAATGGCACAAWGATVAEVKPNPRSGAGGSDIGVGVG
jgi:hypothetical protein